MSFANVGRAWTRESLRTYLKTIKNPMGWKGVCIHHTAEPSLAMRKGGLTVQHIENMQWGYVNNLGWSRGWHLCTDENQAFGMTPLTMRGNHAVSFNNTHIGVEMLGNFDREDPKSGRGLEVCTFTAGRPEGNARKGSYERWAATLSGLLDFCGVEGFLESDKERAEDADPETLAWRSFFAAWWDRYGSQSATAKDLVELAVEHEVVADVPGAGRSLGKRLQNQRGKRYAEYKLIAHKGGGGIYRFSLSRQEKVGLVGLVGFDTVAPTRENNRDTPGDSEEEVNTHIGETAEKPTKPTKPTPETGRGKIQL